MKQKEIKKIEYSELCSIMYKHNEEKKEKPIKAVIVFTEDSFSQPYSLEARSYVVSSDNKAWKPNMGGYSIFASAMDGSDPCVRLERYMACEKGGEDGWKVDYCYLLEE